VIVNFTRIKSLGIFFSQKKKEIIIFKKVKMKS